MGGEELLGSPLNRNGPLMNKLVLVARALFLAVVVALGLLLFATPGRAQIPPLLWGADEEGGAPYVSKDPVKGQVGFEVELAAALARELGQPIQFKQYNFNSLIPGLTDKRDFDFAMNGIEDVPQYRKQVRFSRPYYVYTLQLVVRKDDDRIKTYDDLLSQKDRLTVGTLDGSAAQRSLAKEGFQRVRPYDSQDTLYLDLDNKRIDAIYLDLPVHSYYLPKFPSLKLTGEPRRKASMQSPFGRTMCLWRNGSTRHWKL